MSFSKASICFFLLIVFSSLFACDDRATKSAASASFLIEPAYSIFPKPNFESQSSQLELVIENNGGSTLLIKNVSYQEMDDVQEVRLLDEDDWQSGQVDIAQQSSRRIRFNWNVLDLTPDLVTVYFETILVLRRLR